MSIVATAGCTTPSNSEEEEADERPVEEVERELMPIVDEEPLAEGDIRRLENCAEFPFDGGGPGAWERVEGLKLTSDATARHRTTDRVVTVGEGAKVDALIAYDEGPLKGEWVRIYVGDCQGWQLKGVQKTGDDGYVSYRLDDRIRAGVYGVVFEVVGDQTRVRGQLWVVSPQAQVVVIGIEGAAIDFEATKADVQGSPVLSGATELARWHSNRGRLVAFVDDSTDVEGVEAVGRLESWRALFREERFPVGPVIDLGVSLAGEHSASASHTSGQWGRAGEPEAAGPPLPNSLFALYLADAEAKASMLDAGLEADEVWVLEEHSDDGGGWISLWKQLSDEDGFDEGAEDE